MTTSRQQAEDLANFLRTITPATPGEQDAVNRLLADPTTWITNTAKMIDETPAVSASTSAGTTTVSVLYSPEDLAQAGANRRRNARKAA